MSIREILRSITSELDACFDGLDEEQLQTLIREIRKADRVFVAGAGRSLLMIRGLAMRLMQMGFTAYVVGETVTPAILPGDLLLIASGSGSTGTLTVMAQKCKKVGAALALITTNPDSPIGRLADHIVKVPAVTTKGTRTDQKSVQPGANTFEQSVLLIGDAVIMDIISADSLDEKNEELMRRHANLE